ncbi:MAG: ABC transporter permease, partial [bacterium]
MDPLGIARLIVLKEYVASINKNLIIKSASPQIAKMMDFYQISSSEESFLIPRPLLLRIGEWGIALGETIKELLLHFSESAYWTVASLFLKRGHRKGAILSQALVIGADATPIVSLILFLIGIVLVLLSAQQLKQFGANIYVA